jgi:hypothetical protein
MRQSPAASTWWVAGSDKAPEIDLARGTRYLVSGTVQPTENPALAGTVSAASASSIDATIARELNVMGEIPQ